MELTMPTYTVVPTAALTVASPRHTLTPPMSMLPSRALVGSWRAVPAAGTRVPGAGFAAAGIAGVATDHVDAQDAKQAGPPRGTTG